MPAAHVTYVPGHGDVADVRDVDDFRAYLLDLKRLVGEGRKARLRDEALAQYVVSKRKALHPDWSISDRAAASEVPCVNEELAVALDEIADRTRTTWHGAKITVAWRMAIRLHWSRALRWRAVRAAIGRATGSARPRGGRDRTRTTGQCCNMRLSCTIERNADINRMLGPRRLDRRTGTPIRYTA
jgi:hypothetical protein